MEMLNDSFSLHPNETRDQADPYQDRDNNSFVVISKDDMMNQPQMQTSIRDNANDESGGDQFNQSFGPENSYQQEQVLSLSNDNSGRENAHPE